MQEFKGKTAFVTGGASGIGLALGSAFAEAGMNVMLADIETNALEAAVESLHKFNPNVRGVTCDVADSASVQRAAQATFESFGNVHVLCNNAGVAGGTGIDNISLDSWRWVIDVNLMGVVHGIHAFLPHMRAHGQGGHIVNTASAAGMQSIMGFAPYAASKYAVVSMSEGLALQLVSDGIGVTVLCPSFTRTRISESGRNRQERYGATLVPDPKGPAGIKAADHAKRLQSGHEPSQLAALTLDAIRDGDLYVFTHPNLNWEIEERFAAIQSAMDKAAARV
jgi:NAD(P)-dependent dehydrogenase (short-subunit alcohol dehydrogenase family)